MRTAKDVLEYLQVEGDNLRDLIGENNSEFNKGRVWVVEKILDTLTQLITIVEIEETEFKENLDVKNGDNIRATVDWLHENDSLEYKVEDVFNDGIIVKNKDSYLHFEFGEFEIIKK